MAVWKFRSVYFCTFSGIVEIVPELCQKDVKGKRHFYVLESMLTLDKVQNSSTLMRKN